ncbi:mucin-5AC [Notolabrus celidotus]|uniref:mucin-5AC n=1 Tax=Notolabrus celidotus TaxID=1203425 RepID=UPI00148F7D1A|nr:mucin-5AC [Notolabrus celidotus]
MQLHACLLLVIITTDKTLALQHHLCSGDVNLDQKPAGQINLTLPGLFTDSTNRPNTITHHSDESTPVSLCTWTLSIPFGRTVLLKLIRLESNSSISIRCVSNGEDVVLESSGGTVLLSGCDRNKATLSWTAASQSSNEIQLAYNVQEDDPHSSEDHTNPQSDQDLLHRSQTGTSFTRAASIGVETVSGKEGGRGRLYEGLDSSSGAYSSSQDQGLLHPTSPLQGLAVAGRADREALPLPEEEPNNGADTSGAAHLTDGPTSARERTHPYFQPTLSTVSLFHTLMTENTEKNSGIELPKTQTALTHETESHFNTLDGTDIQRFRVTHSSLVSSSIPFVTSSPPETTRESGTIWLPHHGAVSGPPDEKPPPSWRGHRSTDILNSDLNSSITSDPLNPPTKPPEEASTSTNTETEPTASSSSSSSQSPSMTHSSSTAITDINTTLSPMTAASFQPSMSTNVSLVSATSDIKSQSAAFESSEKLGNTEMLHTFTSPSTPSQTKSPKSTESITQTPFTNAPTTQKETQTATERTQSNTDAISSLPDVTKADDRTFTFTDSSSTPGAALTLGDVVQSTAVNRNTEIYTSHPTLTLFNTNSAKNSPTSSPLLSTSETELSTTNSQVLQTHSMFLGISLSTHTASPLSSVSTQSTANTPMPTTFKTSTIKPTSSHTAHTQNPLLLPSSTDALATYKQSRDDSTTQASPLSITTVKQDDGYGEVERQGESWQWLPSSSTKQTPTAIPLTTPHAIQENLSTLQTSALNSKPTWSSTTSRPPKFYIVPDQPVAIRVESIELLLQIIVEESRSDFKSSLEEDAAAWMEPYLHRAPGFTRLLGVWSSGHAVQSLVQFKTSEALKWLSMTGPSSLLERTGLTQAVRERRKFRSSKITNITLGGLQGDVCDWLLQCPAGYKCGSQPGSSNYSCSSICHSDHCHHHGICTHHPGQFPVCRCLVGEDFWYMGQRCDVRMTRARLVGACLAILLIMVTAIGVLAFVAVRRYKAALIQAKVDQTRSSYRRFNHFDELSGRFWLRSWAGSADSLDNPAFTRSDELLHLRALDRPCCYHDDTLSLASTCPSHGTRINTIYPHSSQYGWRGSEVSMGEGVLDSGKASDLSVCSWPVEPIQWTPFPILQQLASHRTPTVRVSRPRSYCEGMELVDMKSWTA